MSAPLRFLAVVAVGWVAFRVGAIGAMPGADMFSFKEADAAASPAPQPAGEPAQPVLQSPALAVDDQPYPYPAYGPFGGYPPYPGHPGYPAYPPPSAVPVRVPVYYPAYYPLQPSPAAVQQARSDALDLRPLPPVPEWDLAQLGSLPPPPKAASTPAIPAQTAVRPRLDRLQLSSWALLRGQTGNATLASGSTLGGSQAGARLTYAFNRQLAAQLRTASAVGGQRGFEVALGARYQPLRSIPVWINAERRQSFGDYGRSDFALFAEGGVYQQRLPWKFVLDAYLQGGIVGIRDRDLFADGAFTATRPVFRNYSAGVGVWGGAQPGLYRIDAGPRLSMRVRDNIRVHADWRQRLAGKADPGSGPALTLAADF